MGVKVKIGRHVFDYVDWDEPRDVLYLSKGAPRDVPGLHASPEGHHLRIDESGDLQGVTLVGPLGILEYDGRVPVSMPDGTVIGDAEVAAVVGPPPYGPGSVEAGSRRSATSAAGRRGS